MSECTHCRPDAGKKRIMLVADTMRIGGKERVVLLLARQFRQAGNEVAIVTLRGLGEFGEKFRDEGGETFAVESSRSLDFAAIGRLRKFISRFRPDVINVHDRSSLFYTMCAARRSGAKTVLTCHGLLEGAGESVRFDQQWAADRLDAATAVTEHVAAEYTRLMQLRTPVKVISNGIEPVQLSEDARKEIRGEFSLGPDDYVCLSVGNVKPAKGYEDLIDAASAVKNMLPLRKVWFIVVGQADREDYLESLEQRTEQMRVADTVLFVGPRSDVERFYSAADCFVISSRTEGLPMVLLEAMSAGLPVVATSVGGIPNVLSEQCGMLCPAGHPNSLAAAVHKLMTDPKAEKRIGESGRELLGRKFSVTQMTDGYLELYDELCDTAAPRVIIASPFPPLEGGMASVAEVMCDFLSSQYRVTGINTGKLTAKKRSILRGVRSQLQLRRRVVRCVKSSPGGIFHIHTCSGMTFWRDGWLARLAKRKGAKTLMHIHGARFLQFLSQMNGVKRAAARKIFESCDGVIMLGDSLKQKIMQTDIAPKANFVVVCNGVEIPPQQAELTGGAFLFLGNYGKRKGAADLIDAVAWAKNKGVHLKVVLAGVETQPGEISQLREKIDSLGLQSNVDIVGLLKGGPKQGALLHAMALVLPSYREAQPMAILEAMAAGLPVISTDVGDIPSVVRNECEGFIVAPGDIEALAKAMTALNDDVELRKKFGANARARAEEKYSIEESKRQLVKVYDSITGGEK